MMLLQVIERAAQGELVALRAEAGDHADGKVGKIREPAERLACVRVGKMHLDEGDLYRSQGVTQGYAGMRERTRVDQDESGAVVARGLHALDEFVLGIGLE